MIETLLVALFLALMWVLVIFPMWLVLCSILGAVDFVLVWLLYKGAQPVLWYGFDLVSDLADAHPEWTAASFEPMEEKYIVRTVAGSFAIIVNFAFVAMVLAHFAG